eukprot:1051736_1
MKSSRLFMLGLVLLLSSSSVFGMEGRSSVSAHQKARENIKEPGSVNQPERELPKRSLPRKIVNYVLTIAVLALSVCIAWCLAKGAIKIALKLVLVVVVVLVVAGLLGRFNPAMKDAVSDRVQQGVKVGAAMMVNKGGEVLRNPKDALNTVAHTAKEVKGKTMQ